MATDTSPETIEASPSLRRQGRFSISFTLATAIGVLVSVAVLIVLALGLISALTNTQALLSRTAQQGIAGATEEIRGHLKQAEYQTRFIAELIGAGRLDPADRTAVRHVLLGSLAAAPQIKSVLFTDTSFRSVQIVRRKAGLEITETDKSGSPVVVAAFRETERRAKAYWGPPVYGKVSRRTLMNRRQPVFRDGKLIGVVFAVVSVRELSEYLDLLSHGGGQVFMLYDRDKVLAHPVMAGKYPGLNPKKPLPTLLGFADPVLASIWEPEHRKPLQLKLAEGTRGHVLEIFNDEYGFIYRELTGFGDKPILVGAHYRIADVDQEMQRLARAGTAGLIVMLLALGIAIYTGRRIARPILRLAAAATRIGELEFSKVHQLPGSAFKELDDQARAFNKMLGGLRWFETYVPKRLVERLMESGEAGTLPSRDRDLTIMFTDIAGYTSLSEGAEAAEIADFLNEHFGMLADCIEAEGGTVDKFIGDSVMAFWGAPDKQKHRAERAARAAQSIATKLAEHNRARDKQGLAPIRIRIGLHSGTVTVGNIGAPGRLNYTIVGDAVNLASRIEQQGKEHARPGEETTILISGETRAHLGKDFKVEKVGQVAVRGRTAPVELYRLV